MGEYRLWVERKIKAVVLLIQLKREQKGSEGLFSDGLRGEGMRERSGCSSLGEEAENEGCVLMTGLWEKERRVKWLRSILREGSL